MEIIRSNFKENFDLVRTSIEEATFLAIDCEFTGLNEEWNLRAYDTPEERYEKIKDGAMQFLVIQFGLCAFKYNSEHDKYTHKAFNFYIFPRSYGRHSPDPRFSSQASSLEFLAAQGFDFNKLLKEGISFLTSQDEERLKEQLAARHSDQDDKICGDSDTIKPATNIISFDDILSKVPKEHEKFIRGIHSKITNYLATWENGKKLSLPTCTAYQRKLIYESMRPMFNNHEVNLEMDTLNLDNGDKYVQVSKQSPEAAKTKLKEKQNKDLEELDEALGFTKVIRAISKSEKLVVGHNMLLDTMHLVHQFCSPLPESYEDFKNLAHCIFPKLLDTKVMSSTNPFKEYFTTTALNNLLKRSSEKPFRRVVVDAEGNFKGCYSTRSEQLHEAGYDAYITGLCYLSLANYLGSLQKSQKKMQNILPDNPLIKAFTNKLFMMMSPDIPYLNLGGPDLQPNRAHVFYVTFPKEWKTSDIIELFSPCGNSFVSWINNQSAFVALKNPNHAENAKSLVSGDICVSVQVITYDEYFKRKNISKRRLSDQLVPSPNKEKKRKYSADGDVTKEMDLGEAVPRSENTKKTKTLFEEVDTWN